MTQTSVSDARASHGRESDAEEADVAASKGRPSVLRGRAEDGRKSDLFVVDDAHAGHKVTSDVFVTGELPDLAPTIYRQRLVIEGTCPAAIEG